MVKLPPVLRFITKFGDDNFIFLVLPEPIKVELSHETAEVVVLKVTGQHGLGKLTWKFDNERCAIIRPGSDVSWRGFNHIIRLLEEDWSRLIVRDRSCDNKFTVDISFFVFFLIHLSSGSH